MSKKHKLQHVDTLERAPLVRCFAMIGINDYTTRCLNQANSCIDGVYLCGHHEKISHRRRVIYQIFTDNLCGKFNFLFWSRHPQFENVATKGSHRK